MNPAGATLLALFALWLLAARRDAAATPFLLGALLLPFSESLNIGPVTLTPLRMLVLVGCIRMVLRGEWRGWGGQRSDLALVLLCAWVLVADVLGPGGADRGLVFRLGLIVNCAGTYALVRALCRTETDCRAIVRSLITVQLVLAAVLAYEKVNARNPMAMVSSVSAAPVVREGSVRARGPFAHPILAGTVGAVTLPLAIGLWPTARRAALAGALASVCIVVASGSSGPIMSMLAALAALAAWAARDYTRPMRWMALAGYVVLDIVMKAPAYYLIARIDLTGSSTGWHRARLIEMAIQHLGEWWLAGTNYTRHWMPSGVSWNADQTDITNYYLHYGVLAGLPALLLFALFLWKGFTQVGDCLGEARPSATNWLAWCIGADLFAHAVTAISVSYFDQSVLLVYFNVALAAGLASAVATGENGQAPTPGRSRRERRRPALVRPQARLGVRPA